MVFLSSHAPNYTFQHSPNWVKVFNPCRSFFLFRLGSPEARLQVHRILLKFAEKRSAVAPSRRRLDFVMAVYYVIHSQHYRYDPFVSQFLFMVYTCRLYLTLFGCVLHHFAMISSSPFKFLLIITHRSRNGSSSSGSWKSFHHRNCL